MPQSATDAFNNAASSPMAGNEYAGWSKTLLNQEIAFVLENGLAERIGPLVQAGADPNLCMGADDEPLLFYAMKMCGEQTSLALLDNGADVTLRGKHGVTALQTAIQEYQSAVVKRLMAHPETDIHAVCEAGLNALHTAAEFDECETAEALIKAGVDVNAPDQEGVTPLHRACWDENDEFAATVTMIRLLLAHDADILAQDAEGFAPVHFAANSPSRDVLECVLDNGADITARTKDGSTPLHMAASGRNAVATTVLLERNADMNAKDVRGRTPIELVKGAVDDPVSMAVLGAFNLKRAEQLKKLRSLRRRKPSA